MSSSPSAPSPPRAPGEHTDARWADLFDEAAGRRLEAASRRSRSGCGRPTLDEFVGQEHVVGPGRALRARDRGRPRARRSSSSGRPGSGKTTLARIVADTTGAEFEELSAVSATVANVREVLAARPRAARRDGRRTILFLDEIHRFNKAQQDALLPGVEEGLVTLIGATTENPYFELNSALLSRMQLYELEPLVRGRAPRGRPPRRGGARASSSTPERRGADRAARRRRRADARSGSSSSPSQTARAEGAALEERTSRTPRASGRSLYDKGGDAHYDSISAWIKSTRAGDVQASVYYLAAMLEGGEDARFIARRMIVLASEDIGNADPQALLVAVAAAQAVEHVGLPEARLNLAQAAVYLARAPKSNASYRALERRDRRRPRARPPAPAGRAALGRPTRARGSSAAARATSTRTTTRRASRSTACRTS